MFSLVGFSPQDTARTEGLPERHKSLKDTSKWTERVVAHFLALKDIARQAGVALATVDRVVNQRGGVRFATEQRVRQAMDELSRQNLEATGAGRRFIIDLVMDAPSRFTSAVQAALEAELPSLLPAAFRVRAHLAETTTSFDLAAILRKICLRGSHGILLKAPDHPEIRAAVTSLAAARIPVVTMVTDLPDTPRLAYVGADNHAAGATAAWLVSEALGVPGRGTSLAVLISLSSHSFLGEEQREIGFRETLTELAPDLLMVDASEGRGIDRETGSRVQAALVAHPAIVAVYSIGGGNRAIARAFRDLRRPCRIFVGHDLDADNVELLRDGSVDAVLHHDIHHDMRQACRSFLGAHRVLPLGAPPLLSTAVLVTRFNMPLSNR